MKRLTGPLLEGTADLRRDELDAKRKRNKRVYSEDWLIASTVLGLDDPFHHVKQGLQSFSLQKKAEAVSETGEKEFSQTRHQVGKIERQIAQLLATSLKAIQSFEQGWRNVPAHTKRQLLFLMTLKSSQKKKGEVALGHKGMS